MRARRERVRRSVPPRRITLSPLRAGPPGRRPHLTLRSCSPAPAQASTWTTTRLPSLVPALPRASPFLAPLPSSCLLSFVPALPRAFPPSSLPPSSPRRQPTRRAARAASGSWTSRRLVLPPLCLFLFIILDCKFACCWHHDACGPGLLFVRAMSVDLGRKTRGLVCHCCLWTDVIAEVSTFAQQTQIP